MLSPQPVTFLSSSSSSTSISSTPLLPPSSLTPCLPVTSPTYPERIRCHGGHRRTSALRLLTSLHPHRWVSLAGCLAGVVSVVLVQLHSDGGCCVPGCQGTTEAELRKFVVCCNKMFTDALWNLLSVKSSGFPNFKNTTIEWETNTRGWTLYVLHSEQVECGFLML